MVFIREKQQLGLYPLPLQSGEHLQALGVRHPVVMFAVNDQRGRFKIGRPVGRIPLLVQRTFLPGRAVKLPFREPQLFRGAIHADLFVHAVVRDQTFKRIVRAGDPVDHEPAIGSTGRSHPLAVDERVMRQHILGADQNVPVGRAAPVFRHGVGKRLSVTAAAVEVDHENHIAGRGKHLVIPAIVEIIGPGALRPAVDQLDGRVFLIGIKKGRLHDETVYHIAFGAGKTERFQLRKRQLF